MFRLPETYTAVRIDGLHRTGSLFDGGRGSPLKNKTVRKLSGTHSLHAREFPGVHELTGRQAASAPFSTAFNGLRNQRVISVMDCTQMRE